MNALKYFFIGIAIACFTLFVLTQLYNEGVKHGNQITIKCEPDTLIVRLEYNQGYKDALNELALLNLEQELKHEPKTFGELFDILYKRKGIKK